MGRFDAMLAFTRVAELAGLESLVRRKNSVGGRSK
jgi:hypothetical protein